MNISILSSRTSHNLVRNPTNSSSHKNGLRQPTAEFIVVGNELLNGTTLDTNSHWLSKQLVKLGIKVERKTTIRDELKIVSNTFKEIILRKPDWAISVGGLGPTFDDMTIEGLSVAIGKKLYLDKQALLMLKESYKRRKKMFKIRSKTMSRASLKMAMIPRGTTPLYNSVGSAAGVLATMGPTRIIVLPGVPVEMKAIFSEEVKPLMKERSRKFYNAEEWLEAIGISESRLSYAVSRISRKYSPHIYIKSHPMGFKEQKSIIHIQVILTTATDQKEVLLPNLLRATRELELAAKKLGARVREMKSVR